MEPEWRDMVVLRRGDDGIFRTESGATVVILAAYREWPDTLTMTIEPGNRIIQAQFDGSSEGDRV